MGEASERVSRATAMAGGNRLRAALLLDRWAGVLRANDPELARDLSAQAKLMMRRETGRDDTRSFARLRKPSSRLRRMGYRKLWETAVHAKV